MFPEKDSAHSSHHRTQPWHCLDDLGGVACARGAEEVLALVAFAATLFRPATVLMPVHHATGR